MTQRLAARAGEKKSPPQVHHQTYALLFREEVDWQKPPRTVLFYAHLRYIAARQH